MATMKRWSTEEIGYRVQNNDRDLYGALLYLYSYQTASEKRSQSTHCHNGVGFNHCDARILSSMAEFLKRTGYLTPKQKYLVRKKIAKYTTQLTKIANKEI